MESINSQYLKKAKYQKKIDDSISQCLTCERKCEIAEGKTGFCQTRINHKGEIYSIVYGLIPALSFNPIEKKPLYHFHPGSTAITIGTYGCNFSCFWCQNHHLSHPEAEILELANKSKIFVAPKDVIEKGKKNNCQGISISFNEPTLLFEYSIEVFRLAKKEGLYNTYVTNGYMTEKVLRDLVDAGLDAMNIDIKGDIDMVKNYCGIDGEKVWRNAQLAKKLGVHVEITTLLIQEFNSKDDVIRKIATRIHEELGELTPYHISRFFPHYRSYEHGLNKPTPLRLLYNAYNISKEVGLKYVYLGNLPTNDFNSTYCPKCSNLVIKRKQLDIQEFYLDTNGNCKFCGYSICKT